MALGKLREKWFPDGIQCRNPFATSLIDDLSCGILGWRPKWLQYFRSMKVFMACFIILGVFHGMYSTYVSTVIPSIERRFGFTSKQVGTYRAMGDISRILASLVVAHYGGAGHRPRWIGGGAVVLGLGMFLSSATEIMFPVTGRSMVSLIVSSASDVNEQFCHASVTAVQRNMTTKICSEAAQNSWYPLAVLGVGEFIMGLGATSIVILALPFIDDNVATRNSPLYFALTFVGRLFGPLFGFGLGAICTNIFFDFSRPNIKTTDPRWVAAWYLGLLVCACGITLMGCVILLFPSVVRNASEGSKDSKEFDAKRRASVMRKCVTMKDLPRNLLRLFSNVPFMTKLISQLLEALVISGYLSFLQKFIKEQYRVSQSTASLATGIPGVFAAFIGIFIGSFLIKRFKMEPRHVSLLTAVSALVGAFCYFIVVSFGCDMIVVTGVDDVQNQYNLTANPDSCFNQQNCACPDGNFNPLCDLTTGRSYISACVAGCTSAKRFNNTKQYFGCSCLGDPANSSSILGSLNATIAQRPPKLVSGLCQEPCFNFIPYVVIMCIAKLVLGIPISGIVMMQFRLVDYDLKSLANGLSSVAMSLFGFLPAPIIAGAIIDTACRYWQKSPCGDKGSCLLYNAQDFRWKLHVIVGGFKLVTCIMDCVIAWQVWDWKFDRDAGKPAEEDAKVPYETQISSITTASNEIEHEPDDKPARGRSVGFEDEESPRPTVPRIRIVGFDDDEATEADDTVPELPGTPRPRSRTGSASGRRGSFAQVAENMASMVDARSLTPKNSQGLQDVAWEISRARRGSLLDA